MCILPESGTRDRMMFDPIQPALRAVAAVVRELRHLRVAAVRAIRLCADPGFGPCARFLRSAGVGRLGFFEAKFHVRSVAQLLRID